jgi:hypothetical protein
VSALEWLNIVVDGDYLTIAFCKRATEASPMLQNLFFGRIQHSGTSREVVKPFVMAPQLLDYRSESGGRCEEMSMIEVLMVSTLRVICLQPIVDLYSLSLPIGTFITRSLIATA